MNTAQKLTRKNHTSTQNPCKLCSPLGASLVIKGIRGAVPLLHGSQGCSTYIRRYLISHFKEPIDIASSNFGEDTAIFGGGMNLKIALENIINQYNPEIIGVATTCLSETIGDDVKMFVHDQHVEAVSKTMAELQNCVAYYPNEGSDFENMAEPSPLMMKEVRGVAAKYMPLMHHCTRCRADAVGLLGETPDMGLMKILQACEQMTDFESSSGLPLPDANRPHVAVATLEGVLVNQHLGQARQLAVYGMREGDVHILEVRDTPDPGTGAGRWEALAQILPDCRAILVNGVGETPKMLLAEYGIEVVEVEGLIVEALDALFSGKGLSAMKKRDIGPCSGSCGRNAVGCG